MTINTQILLDKIEKTNNVLIENLEDMNKIRMRPPNNMLVSFAIKTLHENTDLNRLIYRLSDQVDALGTLYAKYAKLNCHVVNLDSNFEHSNIRITSLEQAHKTQFEHSTYINKRAQD